MEYLRENSRGKQSPRSVWRRVLRTGAGRLKLRRLVTAISLVAVTIAPNLSRAQNAKPEARALWVTRYDYDSEAKITRIMDIAARANFNIIYFQVRAAGDAFYRSQIEPCAALLCGKLGGTPAYDPLEVAIREGHKRGLQVHAYLNALTGRSAQSRRECMPMPEPDSGNPRHFLLDHPEWVMSDRTGRRLPCPNSEEYVWVSPAYPEVRSRLAHVAADIARRYDIDGIHLDRIRYPGNAWSWDSASRAGFGKDPAQYPAEWKAYRTGLVSSMVGETYDSMTAVKPSLVLSAAVWGIYDDIWHWKTLAGKTDLMQDARAWARGGFIDVLDPMTYLKIKPKYCMRIDWACTLDDHLAAEKKSGRQMYIGIDASKGAREIVKQIRLARSRGATGMSIFSFTDANNSNVWPLLMSGVFAQKARVPAMSWKAAPPPN